MVATGVAADGRREVPGFDVGDSKDGAFWTAFLSEGSMALLDTTTEPAQGSGASRTPHGIVSTTR
jgi:hypothetical protein